jgi:tetratricopeptide (TPR) repeat protein
LVRDPLDEAAALHEQATEALAAGRVSDAGQLATRALGLLEEHGDRSGADAPDTVNVLLVLTSARSQAGELVEAERLSRRAVTLVTQWPSDRGVLDRLRVQALRSAGTTLVSAGRYDEAAPLLTESLRLAEERLGADDVDVAACCNALGVWGKYAGRFEEAEAHYARALQIADTADDADDMRATILHNIGGVRHSAGRAEDAEEPARRAWELRRTLVGADHPDTVADGAALAGVLLDLGRYDEAEQLLRQALDFHEARLGRRHYEVAVALHGLGTAARARGDSTAAEAKLLEALDIKEEVLGRDHPELALTLNNLGVVWYEEGRIEEASAAWRRTLTVLSAVGPDHPARRAAEANLARRATAG